MNELQIFENSEFGQVRFVEIDGKPYAVGNDIAKALEYADCNRAVRDHCKGGVTYPVPTNGGVQETKVIPEGDIYRLIVTAADQSRNPDIKAKAERFESWVFDEVIPSIRRTGSYQIKPITPTEALLQAVQILDQHAKEIDRHSEQINALEETQGKTKQTLTNIKDAIISTDQDWRKGINKRLQRIGFRLGDYKSVKEESYKILEQRGHCRLEVRLENLRARMIQAGYTRTQVANANRLDAIEREPRLKEIYFAIVRELSVKYAA